ncbi:hypothetical protein GQ457_02G031320 [Hibiscus cannabinus]
MECNKEEAVRARGIASIQTDLANIADSLKDAYQIGFQRHRPRHHSRCVTLRSNELFTRLCNLYMTEFRATYHSFESTIEAFDVPNGTTQLQYAVACYISSFFWDLYVSNRKSVSKLPHTTLIQQQHYKSETHYVSNRYDPFLHHLLSVIKPTHLFGTIEDVLYIPLVSNDIDFTNIANPFGISNFMLDEALVQGLLDCMDDERSKWRTVLLSDPHETLGRPFWLLDWRLDQAYAWFPQEGHFAKEDLVAAQILGIPCTPRLGPRDVDDWQFFPGNILPTDIILTDYHRATTRRFYGAAEYRTISYRQWYPEHTIIEECAPVGSKRHQPELTSTRSGGPGSLKLTPAVTTDTQQHQQPSSAPRPVSFYQYQLIDWCYHGCVVLRLNHQAQTDALSSFIFSSLVKL